MRIEVQGSKTDIYNKGEFRNRFSNGKPNYGEMLCVVEAVIILFAHAPNRFLGSEAHEPLLVDEDGQQISREVIKMLLRIAAENTGAAPGDYGSHSLRFGGASALWAAFHDTGLVKRWGAGGPRTPFTLIGGKIEREQAE